MLITLNGEPHELPGPLTVTALLSHLHIDARRVAVEVNLTVLKRATFETTMIGEGDQVEIVNFVGGGDSEVRSSDCGVPSAVRGAECRVRCGVPSAGCGVPSGGVRTACAKF